MDDVISYKGVPYRAFEPEPGQWLAKSGGQAGSVVAGIDARWPNRNALCSFRATGSRKCRYGDRRGGTTYLSDCWRFGLATRPAEIIFMERSGQQERLNTKRSIEIDGHPTGVSLEDAFWNALKEIAATRQVSVSDLIATINKERQHTNLSSVLRLFVLDHYRAQVDAHKSTERPIDEKGRSAHRAAPHHQ